MGAIIDAVNTGPDRLELTTVVSCAKLLPVFLPTVFPLLTSTGKTTICHNDKIILYLPSQAVGAHENHSDKLGECLDNTSTLQEKSKQEAKKLQLEADKAQREANRLAKQEVKNNQNNSKKDNK